MENNKSNNLNELSLSELKEMSDLVTNTDSDVIYQDPEPNQMENEIGKTEGLVIPEEKKAQDGISISGLDPDTLENLGNYVKDMDAQIEERREEFTERGLDVEKIESGEFETETKEEENTDNTENKEDSDMTDDEFNRKYAEAVVVIDKTKFGKVINFTDEEREKLQKSQKIKLEEVETVSLSSIKTKKVKSGKSADIIKRTTNLHTSNIVLPLSGYTASMKGCSPFELISLLQNSSENQMENTRTKWSLIHSKIETTSIGKMDFNKFLHNTAVGDYNILLYGILCATYSDMDTLDLTCDNKKCGKNISHEYSIRSLIRAEKMSDKLRDIFMNIVDNSYDKESAKRVHEESSVNVTKTVELPESKMIVELKVQSAYDLINTSLKSLKSDLDRKYNQAAILSTTVHRAFVIDPESDPNDPVYFEFLDALDITQLIYQLSTKDLLILKTLGDNLFKDLTMEFGLMNVTCPSCRKHRQTVPIENLEDILFIRHQNLMDIKVE